MIYHVYSDESRQTRDRFMVLGGVIIEQSEVPDFNATMARFRKEERMNAELKWNKVSKQKLPQYERFIDYFFALNNTDMVHFHSIVIDNHAVDHRKYNAGDKEVGFYKFYYQLFINCFGKWYCNKDESVRFIVHPDYRTTKYPLGDFKDILNNGMRKQFGNNASPFRSVEPRDSKRIELLQINDLLIGAIGFQKNGYDLVSGSSYAKKYLAGYIANKAGLRTLSDNTPYRQARFKIWNFKLRT